MNKTQIRCGYLPLVDSAPLVIAQEIGFAAEEGLDLQLMRQPSWSALRDRLIFEQVEFAHMLSPMPVAISLGIGGVQTAIDALMVMSVNGNVIGVSDPLARRLAQTADWMPATNDPRLLSQAVLGAQDRPLRVGVPFALSMHRLLLEYWLRADPSYRPNAVEIITVPPPQMASAVRDNLVDMFCVGEPWGTVATQQSGASLVMPTSSIWQFAPEKVLGVRRSWAVDHADLCQAMIRAIYKAGQWLDEASNTPLAIEILARSDHLDLPEDAIEPALSGDLPGRRVVFHDRAANFPWQSQAQWIAGQLGAPDSAAASSVFRSDMFRSALEPMGVDLPSASHKTEGALTSKTRIESTKGRMIAGPDLFFDGQKFDFRSEELPKI